MAGQCGLGTRMISIFERKSTVFCINKSITVLDDVIRAFAFDDDRRPELLDRIKASFLLTIRPQDAVRSLIAFGTEPAALIGALDRFIHQRPDDPPCRDFALAQHIPVILKPGA